jgi:hypothetical protein
MVKQMRHTVWIVPLSLATAFYSSGCGTIAFKQGASAEDFQEAQKECSQSGDLKAAEDCLRGKGWGVAGWGTTANTPMDVAAQSRPKSPDTALQSGPKTPDTAVQPGSKSPDKATEVDDFSVLSWWKAGASADELREALAACGLKGKTRFTSTDLQCMTSKGWNGSTRL